MTNSGEIKSHVRRLILRVALTSAAAMSVGLIIAVILKSKVMAMSVFSGWTVSILSFSILVLTISKAFIGEKIRSIGWAIAGIFKLAIIGALLWILITRGHVEPIAFTAGFSAVIVALLIEGVRLKGGKDAAV